jgi:hypothetical protein
VAVFNIVVRSPDLAAFRAMVFERYVAAGGDGSRFSPVKIFAPHITVVRLFWPLCVLNKRGSHLFQPPAG